MGTALGEAPAGANTQTLPSCIPCKGSGLREAQGEQSSSFPNQRFRSNMTLDLGGLCQPK